MLASSKAAIKKVLMHPSVATRLRRFYYPQDPLLPADVDCAVARANAWLFTQMKSGTTLVCHSLAFYNSVRLGIPNVDFDSIEMGGVGRKVGSDYRCLSGLCEFQKRYSERVVVHTHGNLPGCKPPLLILTTRDPLDYAVSSYFFHFRNRHSKEKTSVEAALPQIMTRFCRTYHLQAEAAQRSEKTIAIRYEQLMAKPFDSLAYCIEQLYGSLDATALQKAIQMASVDRLKSHERGRGAAVVAAEGTFAGAHFVRSGRVGEGAEFFSGDQQALIYEWLKRSHVPATGLLPSESVETTC